MRYNLSWCYALISIALVSLRAKRKHSAAALFRACVIEHAMFLHVVFSCSDFVYLTTL